MTATPSTRTAKKTTAPPEQPAPLAAVTDPHRTALAELRKPFKPETVGKLPRITCRACRDSQRKRCDDHEWVGRCSECNGAHTSAVFHIDFVGHAAVTDRLLAVDPEWTWEPMGYAPDGTPAIVNGCLWIRLTVAGVTRIGVGDAANDSTGSGAKVLIGDALRNAAMRFGVALDLWTKEDLAPVNPITDPILLALVFQNIAEASTVAEMVSIGQMVRANADSLSVEDRDRVNQAWIEKRNKMGDPS